MKYDSLKNLMVCGCICLSFLSTAQPRTTTLSAADKVAIIEIFKGTDPNTYRLQFNAGKEVIGKKTLNKPDLEQIRKARIPAGEKAIIFNWKGRMAIYFKDETLIYVSIVPGVANQNEILHLLGNEKSSKLIAIMIKYCNNPNSLDNATLIDNPDI